MSLLAIMAVLLFSLANGAWIISRMQARHTAVWGELGRPSATLSSGVRPRIALVQYIWSLRFQKLADAPLAIACWAAIAAEVLFAVLFALLVIGTYGN
jgi:hypothetical protein